MAVSIRLRREGAKNRPYYKVVVADSRSPRDGKFIELIGTYDPKKVGHNSTLKLDRVDHWIARGAQPSDTVRSLIKKNRKQAVNAPVGENVAAPPTEDETGEVESAAASVGEETPQAEAGGAPPPLPE